MIVYVESNFVLEMALQQEQCESCRKILNICKEYGNRLAIPSFCVAEPFEKVNRNNISRNELSERLKKELSQIGRSKPYQERIDALREVTSLLVQPNEEERDNLYQTLREVLSIAKIVTLNAQTIRSAMSYQGKYSFSPQDSMVYASVNSHAKKAKTEKKCFITRDNHFKSSDIIEEMKSLNCKMLYDFDSGYGYVNSQ